MITSYLQGGLGNQIFQVVAAYNLAKENGDTSVFNFNTSHTPLQGNQSSKYKNNVFKEFNHLDNIVTENVFSQRGHCFEVIPYKPSLQLQGFFQSEKFFTENKTDIIDKLISGLNSEKEKYDNVKEFISNLEFHYEKPCVSVHIRRGDYLRFPHIHTPCSLDYYKNALSIMMDLIGDFTPIFISDDKQWCKDNLEGVISPFGDELEDLMLMNNCKHNIIANSSFSWWGAYLNKNPNKIVIGPKTWFGVSGPQDQDDTIPKDWIKI
jgi:hypothetical protein